MSSTGPENSHRNFTLYPFLWLSIFFAIGIFLADLLDFDWKVYFFISLIILILTGVFRKKSISTQLILIAFVFAGSFYFQIQKQNEPLNSIKNLYDSNQIKSGDPVEIEGVLVSQPEISVDGFSLTLKALKIIYRNKTLETSGKIRLFAGVRDSKIQTEYDNLLLHSGAKIRVATNLNREAKFLNPGMISFTGILDQKDIYATASIKSPLLIERLKDEESFSPISFIYGYRQDLIKSIRDNFNVSTSGILIASMLGNRKFLTRQTAEVFRNGGTFHILVISGLHITFIGGILLLIVRIFTRRSLWQFIITSSGLWLYAFAVGAEIPVSRAALMFTILLFSFVIYRQGTLLNALGICGLLLLLLRPEDLFSQSFQLTFASLTGIIGVAFPVIEKLRSIGGWIPSAETPFPPDVHKKLKTFCETLYWSDRKWQKTLNENIWSCGIIKSAYGEWLEKNGLQRYVRWIFEGILVTVIVQLFLLPFLIVYFHRISLTSILLNLWVGIFVVLQNVTAIIALFFLQFSNILAWPVIKLTEFLNWILLVFPNLFIEHNLASMRIPIYSGNMKAVYIMYFVPLLFLTFFLNKWNPYALCREPKSAINGGTGKKNSLNLFTRKRMIVLHLFAYFLLFFVIVFHPYSSPPADGKLTIDFLDVGQGDAALITFPNGQIMLVDGGGTFDFRQSFIERESGEKEEFRADRQGIGEIVVSEFLWEKGYSKVDYILATHADADHLQGLIDVAKNFNVKTAFVGREAFDNRDFAEFSNVLTRKQVKLETIVRGDSLNIGSTKINVLHPVAEDISDNESSNDDSVVLQIIFGQRKFLFTGDIEKKAERDLLQQIFTLKSDVIKVAHHGSRTSSTPDFVTAANVDYAVIPVGRKSRFGHPHQEVVERWQKSGARVLTTGERGTITIVTDGKSLKVKFFVKD